MLPSPFEKQLPQSKESIVVEVPRGLRFPAAPELVVGKWSDMEVPTRSYKALGLAQ